MTKKQEETLNILKSKYDVDNIYSTFGQVNFSIDGRVSLGGFIFKNGSVRMVGGRRYIVRDGLLIGLDVWHK